MNKKLAAACHRKRGEHGQVLILAVVALILVILAILLLFDVQTVIRGKVKAQNGVDSAALTAAEWQKHSLNLIGELNLVRATGTLISEPFFANGILKDPNINFEFSDDIKPNFPPVEQEKFLLFPEKSEFIDENDELDKIKLHNELARVELEKRFLEILDRLVSQLQTRIAFTGPLIAFGAAQQAAKNNGITYDPDAGHFFAFYLEIVEHNMLYNTIDPLFFGYDWRNSYVPMLKSAFDINYGNADEYFDPFAEDEGTALYGIAVGTRFKFTGMPELKGDPPTDLSYYFAQKQTYEMIHARNWCWLDDLLHLDFNGNWWTSFLCEPNNEDFPRQSEILPLGITFSGKENSVDIYNEAETSGALARYANDRNKLISKTFNREIPYEYTVDGKQEESERQEGNTHIYETFSEFSIARSSWDIERELFEQTYNDKDADLRYDILPHLSWAIFDTSWTPYGETKTEWEEYLRGDFKAGLDYQSGARAFFETKQNTVTISGTMGRPGRTGGTDFGQVFSSTAAGANARAASGTIQRLNYVGNIEANATAKPIGRIRTENGQHLRPFEAGRMILPVFTKTALIPISLEPVEGLSMLDIAWLYYLTEFVPLLANSLTLEDAWAQAMERYPHHLHYFSYYYQALCMINDHTFRQSGLDWLDATAIWGKDDEGNPYPIYTNREHHCYGLGVEYHPGGKPPDNGRPKPPPLPPGDKKGPASLH